MQITCVTVDCREPSAIAHFWSKALEWPDVRVSESGDGASCHPPSDGIYLEFIQVPERKQHKNRLHLGSSAGSLDELDAEIARLQNLGATIAYEEDFPPEISKRFRNVILRDVEGNEFCVCGGCD